MAKAWLRVAVLVALAAALVVALFVLRVQDQLGPALQWVDEHRVTGAVAFTAVYALATVLFLPGLLLSLGAGAIFGIAMGCAVVWVGAVVGETLAFLLGRLLLRDWLKTLTARYPVWEAVDVAVAEEGWRMVVLLRLAPVVPFAALNYALGATGIPLWTYTWASALGIIPGVVVFVYLGSVAGGISEVLSGRVHPPAGVAVAGVIASTVAIFFTGALITAHARRAIQRRLHAARALADERSEGLDGEQGVRHPDREHGDSDRAAAAPLLR